MDEKIVALWGEISVSVLWIGLVGAALFVAFALKNTEMLLLIVGAIIANGTTIVNYWLGSSSGSKRKDAVIASANFAGLRRTPADPLAASLGASPSPSEGRGPAETG